MNRDDESWTSPSDLADYAYCPRSHFYRHHPPPAGPSAASGARRRAGRDYHRRTLAAERRRADRGGAYWAGVAVGVVLAVGGILWVLRP